MKPMFRTISSIRPRVFMSTPRIDALLAAKTCDPRRDVDGHDLHRDCGEYDGAAPEPVRRRIEPSTFVRSPV